MDLVSVPDASGATPAAAEQGQGRVPTPSDLLGDLKHLADRAAEHESASLAPRTRIAYESDWRQWEAWSELHEVEPLPVQPHLVRLYITDMATQVHVNGTHRFKVSTIERHLASLAWRSRAAGGIHDLARHPLVAPVLSGIRRARAERPRRSQPLLLDDVRSLIGSFGHSQWPDGVSATRDTLALLLGFATALRRSEAAALTVGDLLAVPADGVHVRLSVTKTDQAGEGAVVAAPYGSNVLTCLPCARVRWLRLLGAKTRPESMGLVFQTGSPDQWQHVCRAADPMKDGAVDPGAPLLRAVSRTGGIGPGPITGSALNMMVKRRLGALGYDETLYGFHSLRAGFVTQSRRNGATTRAIRRQSRHATDGSVDVYDREHLPLYGNAVVDLGL